MTVTLMATAAPVSVSGDTISIRSVDVRHREAAAIAAGLLEKEGPAGLVDAISQAIPVGMVALSVVGAEMDSGSVQRTLDAFATNLDDRSKRALSELDALVERINASQHTVAGTAEHVLNGLPAQLQQVLAGEANSVQQAVTRAAQQVQSTGLDELRKALAQHSTAVRESLSLDREGPVQALRRDLLTQLDGTRRELAEQLATVREMLSAAAASRSVAAKASQAIGAGFEHDAMAKAERIVTAAGDLWEATGLQAGVGTTRRVGDGVARLSPAITGAATVAIAFEAKQRSRPLSAKAWRDTLTEARAVREAAGALAIVPDADQVPGSAAFYRADEAAFVVAVDAPIEVIYHVLREIVAAKTIGQRDAEIDLGKLEAQIKVALDGLAELDDMGRVINTAARNLAQAKEIGGRVRTRIHDALTAGLAVLHT